MTTHHVYVSDAIQDATAGRIFLHRVTLGGPAATNSEIFTQDGMLEEPRGLSIVPPDPLTSAP